MGFFLRATYPASRGMTTSPLIDRGHVSTFKGEVHLAHRLDHLARTKNVPPTCPFGQWGICLLAQCHEHGHAEDPLLRMRVREQ